MVSAPVVHKGIDSKGKFWQFGKYGIRYYYKTSLGSKQSRSKALLQQTSIKKIKEAKLTK
jgi:hypothetical protein